MSKRIVYVDNVKVKYLLTSKSIFTFFKMVDGSIKKVLTNEYEYNNCQDNIFLSTFGACIDCIYGMTDL